MTVTVSADVDGDIARKSAFAAGGVVVWQGAGSFVKRKLPEREFSLSRGMIY